jgi:hypothetical protein
MKISIADFNGKNVNIALQAESEAELYQLDVIRRRLQQTFADWTDFDDMNGRSGVAIAAKKKDGVNP